MSQAVTEQTLWNLCERTLRNAVIDLEEWRQAAPVVHQLLDQKRQRERGHEWLRLADPVLPSLDDPSLPERIKRWSPIVKEDGKFWRIHPVDAFGLSFLWEAIRVKEVEFVELARLQTVHSCAYYGFFKPTVAEVVSQIRADFDSKTHFLRNVPYNAFYIDTDEPIGIYKSGSYHRTVTVLGYVG